MAEFKVQAPDGMIIKVEAVDEATAMRGAQEYYASKRSLPPKPKAGPDVGRDVVKSFQAGVGRGADAVGGLLGDMATRVAGDTVGKGLRLAEMVTGRDVGSDKIGKVAGAGVSKLGAPTTSEKLSADRQSALGRDHVPETRAGRYARTAGEFAINAAVPGGAARRVAAVTLPAVVSEYAGEKTAGKPYEGVARLGGAIVGGLGAAAVPSKVSLPELPKLPSKQPVPRVEDLQAAKTAAYAKVKQAGIAYKPDAVNSMLDFVGETMIRGQLNPARAPKAASMLSDLQKLRDRPVSMKELDDMRQIITKQVTKSSDGTERHFGQLMTREIDRFMDNAGGPEIVGGGSGGGQLMRQARAANTRYMKLSDVAGAVDKSARSAAKTGSGGNINNALRQAVDKVAERRVNWTPEERALIDKIVLGDKTANAARQVGKLSPQGNGLSAGLNLMSAASFGPAGAAPGALGMAAKIVGDAITRGRVNELQRLIAAGGVDSELAVQVLATAAESNPRALALYKRIGGQVKTNAPLAIAAGRPAATHEQ